MILPQSAGAIQHGNTILSGTINPYWRPPPLCWLVQIVRGLMPGLLFVMIAQTHAAEPSQRTFDLNLIGNSVAAPQRLLRVDKGETVHLRLTSDTPGDLHLHGYQLAAKLVPGKTATLSFQAYASGRYPFEWHATGDARKNIRHHAPPLAALDVQPK